jgi:hypothetical protein
LMEWRIKKAMQRWMLRGILRDKISEPLL